MTVENGNTDDIQKYIEEQEMHTQIKHQSLRARRAWQSRKMLKFHCVICDFTGSPRRANALLAMTHGLGYAKAIFDCSRDNDTMLEYQNFNSLFA